MNRRGMVDKRRHATYTADEVRALMLAAWDAGQSWVHPLRGTRENDVDVLLDPESK